MRSRKQSAVVEPVTATNPKNPSKKRLEGFLKWEAEAPRLDCNVLLGAALGRLIDRLGYSERLAEQEALHIWATIVGEQIASVTTARLIKDGVLKVEVSNPSWKQELGYLSPEIVARLNTRLGRPLVLAIRFI